MRSKKRTIGILIVVIVVLLGFAGLLLVYRNKLSSEKTENSSDNNFDYYYDIEDEIDKEVDDVLHSTNLSIDESKNKILDILHKFEKEKKIVKDSIEYMENEKIICFQYLHGLDCIINLEKRTPGFSGIADKEKYCAEYKYYDKTTGKFFEYYDDVNKVFRTLDMPSRVNSINFSDSKYPFPEGVISELNLTAKYMYGINDLSVKCDYLKTYQKYQKNWNDIHLKTDIDTYCTVEDFKTGLLNYDIIFIEEHGEIKGLLNKVSLILTLEECNRISEKQYKSDIRNLSKVMYKDDLKNYWAIKPLFFEKYYENNRLKNTIVWIGSCKGYMQDDLVNIFEKCGASAVIGYDNSVNTQYDMLLHNGFVYSLMHGDTVSDALEFSKSIWKSDDRTYCYSSNPEFKVDKKEEPHGAVAKVNPNGKNARLINLPYYSNVSGKVTDESNNPIKDAEIIINNVRGMSHGITATTNENGEYTLECPQDSYKIGVKADGYEVFETDDFVNVVYGEETIFNITLKKVIEPTDLIEPTFNYSAVDLIDKTIPEIISLMNGEYQIIQTEMGGYYNGTYSGIFYIQNQSVFPGMEFYVETLLNESVDFKGGQSTGKEIQSNGLRKNLEAGKYALDVIQVNKSGKATDSISADMDYIECSKALGNFDCIQGNGGYIGGSPLSALYTYNEKSAKIELHFIATSEMFNAFRLSENNKLSSEQMKSFNPSIMNIVIRKSNETKQTTPPTEPPTEIQTEPISELKIETGKLSDSDITSEWQHVLSLDFEYPIFKTDDKDLKDFLDISVTNEILSYMATDSDYNLFISGGFEYDMSIDGYLSIEGWINNHPEGGQGYLGCENYTFFVDLKNRRVLSLKDLFSESEDLVYNEIREKSHNYSDKNVVWESSLSNYDYEKCKFLLNKDKLTLIFSPYEVSTGAVGTVKIEIPVSDINLTCVIPGVETNGF